MKEISQPPRSSAQKVTSKSLQRVMISSGLSIALCMGCIAGSAWALFQADITANSVLALADLTPTITDKNGTKLSPVAEGMNTFLLEANKTYDLSVSYIGTEDDLGMVWDVDAMLSFKPVGTPQPLENTDLPAPEPEPTEPSSPEEDPAEETPAPPDNERPSEDEEENAEQSPAENVTDSETEETPIPEEEQAERPEEEQTEHSEEDSTTTEEVHAQSSDENTDTEGSAVEGESTDTELEDTTNEETEQPSEETTDEEESEKNEQERIQELLDKLQSDESGEAINYHVHLLRNGTQSSFSVNGISVRQNTLVTFQTVNSDAGKVSARAAAFIADTVPKYYQNDYPDTMYGSGTIASSGCSAVSLAMIATYMTNYPYLPDEMARYFGGAAENDNVRLEKGLEMLHIPYEKPENIDVTYAQLLEGKVAIALMGKDSYFTNSQHFIVLAGVTEDGKILVNDPNRDNEGRYPTGFSEGFTKGTITAGYQGAWVFDKSQMPEEPFIYQVPEPEHGIPRYPDISLTASQKEVIARIVYLEARGESPEGQQAVAEVILNRLASNRFGLTLKDVIFGEGQFRTADLLDTADPYQTQYEAIERAIWGPYVLPSDIYYFAREPMTNNVWDSIGNHVFSGAPIG